MLSTAQFNLDLMILQGVPSMHVRMKIGLVHDSSFGFLDEQILRKPMSFGCWLQDEESQNMSPPRFRIMRGVPEVR